MRFSTREIFDLGIAWLALGLAFTFFFLRRPLVFSLELILPVFIITLITVGTGFLLHELAHKVTAIHFNQIAEFRADYGMLFFAVVGGLAGFIFAAPGAVHHRGYLSDREHGLIALAGPVTNLLLAVVFVPVWFVFPDFGGKGVGINIILAGFNMLPFGGLDGQTVLSWNKGIYVAIFIPALIGSIGIIFFGIGL